MAKTRDEIKTYILDKLKEVFYPYKGVISEDTSFRRIYRKIDMELVDLNLIMDIEEEMEIELREEDIDLLDDGKVRGLIDLIHNKTNTLP